MATRKCLVVGFLVVAVICLVLGIVIGYLIKRSVSHQPQDGLTKEADESIQQRLLEEINAENIRDNLRELTRHPHLAGTPADLEQAEYLTNFWDENGFDRTALYPYKVMLSYPKEDEPNRIVLYNERNSPVFTSQLYERILRPEQNQSDVVPPFNAYSASGTPKGDLVYVNYGRIEDFMWLHNDQGLNVSGKICIARYGKIFRGDKARLAERYGCSGLVIYTDPADYAIHGHNITYPDSFFLPSTGVQRGTLILEVGDPLTPGYPSLESAYRIKEEDSVVPRIPVHPISYGDAKHLLEQMTGDVAPDGWQGDLPMTYKLGPGFNNQNWKVQMFISTHGKTVTTYNAMGFIEGAIEPDRYVLLGNHRDAWVFGAVDPSSGTATMMELSRALGALLKQGWRPRRTIVFCSWGAEEQGLVGSREWVEHYGTILGERAVAYLNVDIAVQGNFSMRGRALPLLHNLLKDAAKVIPNPNQEEIDRGRPTVYDTWVENAPQLDSQGQSTGQPKISILGSGSDFAPLISKVGLTCADLRYHFDPATGLSSYPLYHSVYETFHLVETYYDPTFAYHKAVAQYWGEIARRLADLVVLPLDVRDYAKAVKSYVQNVENNYKGLLDMHNTNEARAYLSSAVDKFIKATEAFHDRLGDIDKLNPIETRMFNDQMMKLERMFIDPLGLPGRKLMRHVVFAPSAHNAYAGASFPGLVDSLFELQEATDEEDTTAKAEVVKQQLAVITYFIDTAASSLERMVEF